MKLPSFKLPFSILIAWAIAIILLLILALFYLPDRPDSESEIITIAWLICHTVCFVAFLTLIGWIINVSGKLTRELAEIHSENQSDQQIQKESMQNRFVLEKAKLLLDLAEKSRNKTITDGKLVGQPPTITEEIPESTFNYIKEKFLVP